MKFMCYLSYLRRITCDVLMICYIRSMEWIDQDEFVRIYFQLISCYKGWDGYCYPR
ncbi:hypothetical protein HanRHA438_Chr00c27g0854351 [Helianthus annuus]|nr:hypothetical protein HanHA89_Chr17g0709041 [Helianthus annuus]KAJ0632663.1 hypothetical protein HanLR1_Chr17g0667651 [Helianthus annuus]KAJ0826585.1 hypothetical protein HanRHA438_Chr17g0815971 [Helianthus annuus]KAJ0954134.1 hypothetical protein HanRHA438_Chr00c27g0854351 [Helianthus annuus]